MLKRTPSDHSYPKQTSPADTYHAFDPEQSTLRTDTIVYQQQDAGPSVPLPFKDDYPQLRDVRLSNSDGHQMLNDPQPPRNSIFFNDNCSAMSSAVKKNAIMERDENAGTDCHLERDGGSNLRIQILGVPHTGAKSRVETQIKICLRLLTISTTDDDQNKVNDWSYIRLHESMLANSKLRRASQQQQQQQHPLSGAFATTIVSDESKILQLDAKVVCSTNLNQPIRTCAGCVRREKKRAERTKDRKNKQPRELTVKEMDAERNRIVIFNCNSLMNFSSGDVVLPTRITCYCRHHNEKTGFRIRFALKNHEEKIIATGISPPIMITDDHKNTDQRKRKRSNEDQNNSTTKRSLSVTPNSSRRSSVIIEEVKNSRSPLTPAQTPPSITDEGEDIEAFTPNSLEFPQISLSPFSILDDTAYADTLVSKLGQYTNLYQPTQLLSIPKVNQTEDVWLDFYPQQTETCKNANNNERSEYDFFSKPAEPVSPISTAFSSIVNSNAVVNPTNIHSASRALPRIEKIVPSRGPTHGGTEVTLLGSGFYEGLTCLFGENSATTVFWTDNTMVCVLPPASHSGPVVVSFKEHPLIVEGGADVAIFTYYDAADQALLELALQVVGLKMMGQLQNAKQVAMDIVHGGTRTSIGCHEGE